MGCDGGTIPTRDEMVKLKKKPEKKDKDAELMFKWKCCAISQEKLQQPIVACELGRLYKKDKVIEFLLDRSKFESGENFEHIKGLKDVKELNLTENSAYKKDEADKEGYVDRGIAEFICPITGLEMSGRFRFVIIWGCGCVLAERTLKEIKCDNCIKCQKPFKTDDIVVLNGTEEDLTKMKANMEQRRLQAKLQKKSKKKQKAEAATGSSDEPPAKQMKTSDHSSKTLSTDQPSTSNNKITNGINGHKVLSGKLVGSHQLLNGKSSESKSKGIQNDPKASHVFKSLFTTSEKAKNQPKGHWVTYNPCYN